MPDSIEPDHVLLLEPRKVVSYVQVRADGSRLLRVAYGDKVVEFDDDTLAVGQRIFAGPRFRAGDAADGRTPSWGEVKTLLESLLAEGILRHEGSPEQVGDAFPPPSLDTDLRAPMPPIPWRSVTELCDYASARFGHAVRPEVPETSIGARTLTQVIRDDDGRQGGENGLAMVSPKLTDAVPTEWRPCKYRGSRFGDPRPMNVSALRQVQRHMRNVLASTSALRMRYLERAGLSQLDLGHMCVLAEIINVLPAWLLVRPRSPIASGEQPAWVHSLAKTVAGIDMALRYLVDESEEHPLGSPVTAEDIHRAAEFSGTFATASAVCAGSGAMIDEADRAFTGEDIIEGGEALLENVGRIDEFLDYGLAWCRLASARMLGECRTLAVVEGAVAAEPDRGPRASLSALAQVVLMERLSLDRAEGPLERRVEMLERKFRSADELLATRAPGALARLSVDTGTEAPMATLSGPLADGVDEALWAPAFRDVLATERRTLAVVGELQNELDRAIGRGGGTRVVRSDLASSRRLRGRELLSDGVAKFLGLTLRDNGEGGLVIERASTVPV